MKKIKEKVIAAYHFG